MIKKKVLILFFFFILILNNTFSHAAYKKEIIKSLTISEEYDDNIYLLKEKRSDWITTVSPSISVNMYSPRASLNLSYSPTWTFYKKYTESNTLRHFLNFNSSYGIKKHLWFYLSDQYEKSEEPIEQIGTWRSQAVRRTRNTYQRNLFDTNIKWEFKRKSYIMTGFSYDFLENTDPTYDNTTEYGPYIRFSYWRSVKNGVEINYRYKKNRASREVGESTIPDFNGYDWDIKYTHFFNKTTDIYVGYRYVKRNFLKSGYTTLTVDEYRVGIDKAFSPKLKASFVLFYFKPNGFKEDKGHKGYLLSIKKTYKKQDIKLTYQEGWDEGYLESERREFTRYNMLSLNYKRKINHNTILTVNYYYRKNIYQRSSDKNYEIDAALTRKINKWLQLIFSYSHLKRTSDIPWDEFDDNRMGVTIKITK